MPTARELLEQADALMRRNRAGSPSRPPVAPPTESRIPTGPPSGIVASPRPIQREPIAPSVVHTSLPVDDTAEFAEPAVPAELPAPADEFGPPSIAITPDNEADFPLLTDAIEAPSAQLPAAGDDVDDLPVLTDAVTEIDAVAADVAARGEPSLWELTARGETSVLGPAPDSIVAVPAAEPPAPVPQAPPEGRDPLGLDQPAPGFAAEEVPTREGSAADAPAATSWAERSEAVDDEPHVFSASVSHMAPEDAEEAAVGAGDPPALDASPSSVENESAAPGGEAPGADADRDVYGGEAFDSERGEPAATAEAAGDASMAPLATPSTSPEQERIREIAEEIGMQVLQRIDIFTDTTLRAQLGERLRPVVDRAAADLVAAINEHVGELLRAQVSEAIEREIESWRNR